MRVVTTTMEFNMHQAPLFTLSLSLLSKWENLEMLEGLRTERHRPHLHPERLSFPAWPQPVFARCLLTLLVGCAYGQQGASGPPAIGCWLANHNSLPHPVLLSVGCEDDTESFNRAVLDQMGFS